MLREETQGEFEIEREIGRGGMAVVYFATGIHVWSKIANGLLQFGRIARHLATLP